MNCGSFGWPSLVAITIEVYRFAPEEQARQILFAWHEPEFAGPRSKGLLKQIASFVKQAVSYVNKYDLILFKVKELNNYINNLSL